MRFHSRPPKKMLHSHRRLQTPLLKRSDPGFSTKMMPRELQHEMCNDPLVGEIINSWYSITSCKTQGRVFKRPAGKQDLLSSDSGFKDRLRSTHDRKFHWFPLNDVCPTNQTGRSESAVLNENVFNYQEGFFSAAAENPASFKVADFLSVVFDTTSISTSITHTALKFLKAERNRRIQKQKP